MQLKEWIVLFKCVLQIHVNNYSSVILSGAFDLLIFTDKELSVPEKWEESGPQFITNSEEVRLRSFTTTIHKVSSMVAYKKDTLL